MQVERNSQTTYYGIKQYSQYGDLNIYRPFINKRKKELLAYCKKHKIPYGIDETNADTKFTRNRIRESLKGFSQKQFDKYIADFTRMNKQLAKLEDFSNQAYEQ
ncbi:MAG: hypothetical protein HUJ68_01455 [Clostridia bacterium]|nr:hypothetical protein [Clostridia bacterium]